MLKKRNKKSTFSISNSPLSLKDIPRLVLNHERIQRWTIPKDRVRKYVHYRWSQKVKKYLQDYQEFILVSHSWMNDSWFLLPDHHSHKEKVECPLKNPENLSVVKAINGDFINLVVPAQDSSAFITARLSENIKEAELHVYLNNKHLETVSVTSNMEKYAGIIIEIPNEYQKQNIVLHARPKDEKSLNIEQVAIIKSID